MRVIHLSVLVAALAAGCAVEPVAVAPPPVTLVACNLDDLVAPCYDVVLGYYYAPPNVGVVGWYPAAPVGYVSPFGVTVGIGLAVAAVLSSTIPL